MGLVQSIILWWRQPRTVDDLTGSKRLYTIEEEEALEIKLALVQEMK